MKRVLLLLLAVAACDHKSNTTLSATHYDRACKTGGDCTPIFEGEYRSCQGQLPCPNAAIREEEIGSYEHDVSSLLAPCDSPGLPVCQGSNLTCVTGQCEFHKAGGPDTFSIATTAYPKTCASIDDCVPVYHGALGCCGTTCPNTAISASAEADYKDQLARRAPSCFPPPPCLAPAGNTCPGRIDCQNGQCVLLGGPP